MNHETTPDVKRIAILVLSPPAIIILSPKNQWNTRLIVRVLRSNEFYSFCNAGCNQVVDFDRLSRTAYDGAIRDCKLLHEKPSPKRVES